MRRKHALLQRVLLAQPLLAQPAEGGEQALGAALLADSLATVMGPKLQVSFSSLPLLFGVLGFVLSPPALFCALTPHWPVLMVAGVG